MNSLWRWLPVEIAQDGSSLPIGWQFVGDHRFTAPFFQEELLTIPKGPHSFCRTSPEAFEQIRHVECLCPAAFLFHASRCGSTLISQLLATLNRCLVISEAAVIDSALRLCRAEPSSVQLLQHVVRALGQRRCGDEQHLFVKLDSWHITQLPLIRQAFPAAPCFFVYRHPGEILASHRKQRGQQMVPGLIDPVLLGLDPAAIDAADLDGYCLQVLSAFFTSARRHAESGDLTLINYTQLPEFIWQAFAGICSLSLSDQDIQLMRERSRRHSKSPNAAFETSGHATRQADSDSHQFHFRAHAAYRALEELRRRQDSKSGSHF